MQVYVSHRDTIHTLISLIEIGEILLRATFHTYQYDTFEWVFVYRYVTTPIFRCRSIIFAWNRITKFSRFLPTIFRICKWIWIRVRRPLWDRRNICGGYAQIEVVLAHKPQFTNCFSNSRQSALVPAIGNLLSRTRILCWQSFICYCNNLNLTNLVKIYNNFCKT